MTENQSKPQPKSLADQAAEDQEGPIDTGAQIEDAGVIRQPQDDEDSSK